MKRALFGIVLGFVASQGAAAAADEYPFDLAKKDPPALRAWRAIVPGDLRRQSWVYGLDGTSGPLDRVKLHDRVFYSGYVCKPHDCAGNTVALLVASGGGEAYGAIASDTLGIKRRYLGAPDGQARELLDKLLNN